MHATTLDAVILEKLISAGIAAPSIHNTQPWRYRLDPDTVTLEIRAAEDRGLPYADPQGRALHVSIGAALFNVRIAVAHFGWEPVVRLLPDPAEPDLLACVRLAGPRHAVATHRRDLYDAIWRRHSSRLPFSEDRLPPRLLAEMAEAARAEGAALHLLEPEETARLLHLTAEAEQRNHSDPDRRAESRRWIRDDSPDGLPVSALGPQDAGGRVPVRDFSSLRPGDQRPSEAFETTPHIGVLTTTRDSRADWLRAGQALEHILLLVAADGAAASLLHQALEWPDLRWILRDSHDGPGHVQMVLRLGYGPEGPATPRRAARDVLEGSAADASPR